MAKKGGHFTTDRAMKDDPTLNIVLTSHALANLELRSINVSDVKRVLQAGNVERVDDNTGHFVYRIDDNLGSIRVVAKKEGNSIIVLTAMRPEEFIEHAK